MKCLMTPQEQFAPITAGSLANEGTMESTNSPERAPQRSATWPLLALSLCIAMGVVWLSSGTGADVKFDSGSYYVLTDLDQDSVQAVTRLGTESECKEFVAKLDPKDYSVCRSGAQMASEAVNFVKVVKTPTGMLVSRGK